MLLGDKINMIFTKDRKDAKYVAPKDTIQAIVPYIMPKRGDAEVSYTSTFDVTKLCKYVDSLNREKMDYKVTYFHALLFIIGMTVFNRKCLNRFIKNKRLYQRNKITFSFIAKNKLKDDGEERIISVDLNPDDTLKSFSKRVAVDVFKVRKDGTNSMNDALKFLLSLPNWLLNIVAHIVFFLDKHGWNPKALTEGDTNYSTIIFSNLGSIGANSCYHHLNEYGTNSIVVTVGTIKEVNNKKSVDVTFTLDERIADGFYFAKSVQLAEYIARSPELYDKKINTKVDFTSEEVF